MGKKIVRKSPLSDAVEDGEEMEIATTNTTNTIRQNPLVSLGDEAALATAFEKPQVNTVVLVLTMHWNQTQDQNQTTHKHQPLVWEIGFQFVPAPVNVVTVRTLKSPFTKEQQHRFLFASNGHKNNSIDHHHEEEDFLLTELFPRDDGKCIPNLAMVYNTSTSNKDKTSTDPMRKTLKGKPYYWAQWISGMAYLRPSTISD